MSAYHEGIDARKKGIGKHENPYDRPLEFIEFLFSPGTSMYVLSREWARGWEAHDAWMKESISPHPIVSKTE